MISKEKILNYLKSPEIYELIVFDEIDSTNTEAKRLKKDNAVIVADFQTNGRGRLGRNFYSPKNCGIYMTLSLKPDFSSEESVLITTAASVLVARAIEKTTGKLPLIKWVNDLYLNNKKICGILTEAVYDVKSEKIEHIIIGIGINCFNSEFPDEISGIAGTLLENDYSVSREEIIAEILNEFCLLKQIIKDKSFISDYKKRSMVLGKEIEVIGKGPAIAVDIDQNGALVADFKNGERHTLNSGEISIRLKEA